MSQLSMPHDRVFRAAMADLRVAKEFLQRHLPETLTKAIDFDSLHFCPQSYIDSELKLAQSDVLYQAQIAHEVGYLFFLCEHQRKADPLMPFRLLKYNVGIWSDYLKKQPHAKQLPLIVNMVFYNGEDPYTYSTDMRDILKAPPELIEAVWGKPFTLIDTHHLADEELKKHLWSGTLEFFLKHVAARDFLPYLQDSLQVLKALEVAGASEYVVTLLNYMLLSAETEQVEKLVETVKDGLSKPIGEKVMTIAEQLIEKGRKSGLEQGIQQGTHMLFIHQLQRKFSLIPDHYLEQINAADEALMLIWGERLIDAQTLEDIFAPRH